MKFLYWRRDRQFYVVLSQLNVLHFAQPLCTPPPPHVSFPRSHIGGDFQILSASVVIQSAGVTTHHYSVFTFNSKRRRLRVVAPRSVSLQGKIQYMEYESASENHTIEEGHTHFPRLASPRTQRSSRAFAYFTRSTIPMEKTFLCVFFFKSIYSFIFLHENKLYISSVRK